MKDVKISGKDSWLKLIFRCAIILSILLIVRTEANAQSDVLETRLSIQVFDEPINQVLLKIAKITQTSFSFNSKLIPSSEKISLDVKDKSINELFELIFANYNIEFKSINGNIFIYKPKSFKTIFKVDVMNAVEAIDESDELSAVNVDTVLKDSIVTEKKDTVIVIPEVIIETEMEEEPVVETIEETEPIEEEIIIEEEVTKVVPDTVTKEQQPQVEQTQQIEPVGLNDMDESNYFSLAVMADHLSTTSPIGKKEENDVTFNQEVNAGFGIGVALQYTSKRFGIDLGVHAFNLNNQISSEFYTDTTYMVEEYEYLTTILGVTEGVPSDTVLIDIYDTTEVEALDSNMHAYAVSNKYSFLEIPLRVNYSIVKRDKFTLGISLGITTSILVNKSGGSISNQGYIEEVPATSKTVFMSAQSGINMAYQLNKKMDIVGNVTYRRGLQPIFTGSNYSLQTIDFIGIGLGISYRF